MISAKIVADSKNEFGNRLTTFVLVFPRIVLAEFNTHRMFSRNSASSRAIPFEKMLNRVQEDPFIPIKWMKEHKGMQGTEYFDESEIIDMNIKHNWLESRNAAIEQAKKLSNSGLTKQIVNRLLEPFMWHTVIITSSTFENFFALRAHPAAEIHIAKLAELMLEEYNKSTPKELKDGEWHIPFGDNMDEDRISELIKKYPESVESENDNIESLKIKIATARCARVSYLNFEGKDDYAADIKLFDMLSTSGHWSPFEHCAKSMNSDEHEYHYGSYTPITKNGITQRAYQKGACGNFMGFVQYRKMFEGENKIDNRVIKK